MDTLSVLYGLVDKYDLNVLLTRCQDHAVAVNAAELAGLEVYDNGNLFADELIGGVELCNSRHYLPKC